MEVFCNRPEPGFDDGLASGPEEDAPEWCAQLREAATQPRQVPAVEGKRSPGPWRVPLGLPPRPPAQVAG
jgi:hypothetical protein